MKKYKIKVIKTYIAEISIDLKHPELKKYLREYINYLEWAGLYINKKNIIKEFLGDILESISTDENFIGENINVDEMKYKKIISINNFNEKMKYK